MAVRIPSPPSHRRPTPDHPPYAEMVLCALKTLAEPRGSAESSISTFIQANYTSLPWGHSKLLPYYLNKLLIAGEIIRSKSGPNCYALPRHIPSLRVKKPVKKNKGLQDEMDANRRRGRSKKHNSNSSEKVTNNAVEERKGTILKFKRKCPEGDADANASDGGWMFSNNKTHEQEDEALHGAECNERNIMLLALPAFKSINTKMEENGCNEKVVELQKKHVKGMGFDMQNENLLALEGKDSGDMKIDVNGKEMTLQEKDCSAIKIDNNDQRISVLQDKNCSLSVIAENGNEKDKDIGHMNVDVNGEKMLALQENDCSAAKIIENDEVLVLQDKKCSLSAIADNGSEMLATQEKDMKGVEFNIQSNTLFALKEKDFGDMKIDVNGEEPSALQDKDTKDVEFNMQNENLLPSQGKDSGNMKIDVNGEEKLALQEKDTKGVEFNIQNDNLFPLHEKDSDDMKIDVNDEALMLALKEKECSATKVDENDERISVLQDKNLGISVIADNCNEISLHEGDLNVIKNEDKGSLLASLEKVEELSQTVPCVKMDTPSKKSSKSSVADTPSKKSSKSSVADTPSKKSSMSLVADTPSKKSKPKKLRKLWFES